MHLKRPLNMAIVDACWQIKNQHIDYNVYKISNRIERTDDTSDKFN